MDASRRSSMLGGMVLGLALAGVALWLSEQAGVAARRQAEAAPPAAGPAPPTGAAAATGDEQYGVKYSFAQQGEDVVMMSIFRALHIMKPTYLDVGAWDPIESNNTFLAYLTGGRGVLVEPNPAYTARLKEKRPGDVVLQAGIGFGPEEETQADYYLVEGSGQLNTFDGEHAGALRKAGHKVTQTKATLYNINSVITKHLAGRAPDLLSVDVEGLDLEILQTLDFTRYRPAVICVETMVQGTLAEDPAIARFLTGKGYVLRGLTLVNSVFVDAQRLAAAQGR